MKAINSIKLEFPSKSSNESFARAAAAAFAAQLDPTMEELGDLRTAVSEAVTNAIVHAYPDSIGVICMKLRILEGGVFEVSVRDWGRGIDDLEKAMTPLYSTGGEEPDRLRVRSAPGKGTTVVMQKCFSPRAVRV